MRTYLISYDLAKPNRNKHVLAQEIMGLGERWARPLENTWYIATPDREGEIELKLAGLLDADDGLLIQAVEDEAILTNTSLRWFRQRRSQVDFVAGSNILAFPSAQAAPPAQAELPLPFAQAS